MAPPTRRSRRRIAVERYRVPDNRRTSGTNLPAVSSADGSKILAGRIGVYGAGLALAITVMVALSLAGAPLLAAVLLATGLLLAIVGVTGRVTTRAQALPRRIDPFALKEPWRFYVREAIQTRNRLDETMQSVPDGPLRAQMLDIVNRVGVGVEECWRISQRGQALSDARRGIDLSGIETDLARAAADPDLDERRAALEAQLDSAKRLDDRVKDTTNRLETLEARMEESAVRCSELASTLGSPESLGVLAQDVSLVVDDLEALRQALESDTLQ